MKKIILAFLVCFSFSAQAGNFERIQLGNTVDHSQIWSSAGDAVFHELNTTGTDFRTTAFTAPSNGWIKVSTCLHIRSGDSTGHSRLYSKFYTEIFNPTDSLSSTAISPPSSNVTLDRESLWEGTDGYGDQIHFFDASGCWIDSFHVNQNDTKQFRVMVLCGQTIHCEVSYGSTLTREFWPD